MVEGGGVTAVKKKKPSGCTAWQADSQAVGTSRFRSAMRGHRLKTKVTSYL